MGSAHCGRDQSWWATMSIRSTLPKSLIRALACRANFRLREESIPQCNTAYPRLNS
jgi:hypothetical protein